MSLVDPIESTVWFYYENLDLILTVNGEQVDVHYSEVYFDEERGETSYYYEEFNSELTH